MIFKVFFLVALIKLLLETNQPFLCSGIYAALAFGIKLMFGRDFGMAIGLAVVAFLLATAYFWLLDKLEGSGGLWWVVLVGGIVIGLV